MFIESKDFLSNYLASHIRRDILTLAGLLYFTK